MSPTYLCLGGQRCGTTWLHEALKLCPHVQVSDDKETDFFNRKILHEGLANYERNFESPGWKSRPAVRGEVSPNYCMLKRPNIELIHKLYPHLRLVLFVRNPVERSLSQAWLDLCHMRQHPERVPGVLEYLLHAERQRTRRRNDYVRIIQDWQAVFGREALHVGLYDDLVADPRHFFRDVLRHLGAEDWLLPPHLESNRVFASGMPPAPALVRWYYARQYREQVVALNDLLQGRVTGWLRDLDVQLAAERPWWNLVRGVNRYGLSMPEKLAYAVYDWWRDARYNERAEAILQEHTGRAAVRPKSKPRTGLIPS